MTICRFCNKPFNHKNGKNRYKCRNCVIKDWRRRLKEKAVNYKGGKCICCGYNKCIQALQFHHLDSSKKDFQISNGNIVGWEKVKIEIDKCILVCGNCHVEIHMGIITPSPVV